MPTISAFYGIVIRIYWDDHSPPHFHAKYAGENVAVEIHTLRIISGSLQPRALSLVVEWATLYQAELLENWSLCVELRPPKKIPPLP